MIDNPQVSLRRSISLPMITLYGLGTILGAGIYVLIGEVARFASIYAPLAFLLASVIAAFTAFTYAELSSRIPRSAGEAVYLQTAFGVGWLSALTGWAMVAIGTVSAATIARGFVGYAQLYIDLPGWLIAALLLMVLGALAAWGIRETAWVAVIITVAEILGLVLVIVIGSPHLPELLGAWPRLLPPLELSAWSGILAGTFLAFFAFIGFEDMVNVAEEVKEPRRNLPVAIVLALLISTLIYVLVMLAAIATVPVAVLSDSSAPLAEVVATSGLDPAVTIGPIGMVAVVNGALVQLVMASRVLYGMARSGLAADRFAVLGARTRTPLLATFLVSVIALVLATLLPLVTLASLTSVVTLLVFTAVNVALVRIKKATPRAPGSVSVPVWVPWCGATLCLALLLLQLFAPH